MAQEKAQENAQEKRASKRPRKNRTLAGPVVSLSARGPTFTFQRGTATGSSIAIWEDKQPLTDSERRQYDAADESNNTASRMPAMRVSQADKFMRRICARNKPAASLLKVPALRFGDQEVAEYLHARHRFQ